MLLCRHVRQRLEPVREVCRAVLHRPDAHRFGDGVGESRVERSAVGQSLLKLGEDGLRQSCPLSGKVENVFAINGCRRFGDVGLAAAVSSCCPLSGGDVLLTGLRSHLDLQICWFSRSSRE